jgi:hypothetical protein
MTPDLSYSLTRTAEGLPVSVNSRIGMHAYSEIILGWCLLRIIHLIVSIRLHYPKSRILISKYDYSDAYRRMAHSASEAAQNISVSAGLAFTALPLTFGGSTNHPSWTLIATSA